MNRKTRFAGGLVIILFIYSLPLAALIYVQNAWFWATVLISFAVCLYMLYRLTIKNVKLRYPLVAPDGKPDAYTGNRIPRPVYEDVQRYPWFFHKKHAKKTDKKRRAKKH